MTAAAEAARRPVDLVVAGPPKSGTSTLFAHLERHPGLCTAHAKEPVFFSTDRGLDEGIEDGPARGGTHGRGRGWYDDLFRCPDPSLRRLEGTTDYFPSRSAPALLAREAPGVHVAFCLREPARRLVSHYWHEARFADLPDLDVAVDVEHPRFRYWLRCSRYGEHLARWLEHHDPAHLHPLGFTEVTAEPAAVAARLCRALGLPDADLDEVELGASGANAAGSARSRRLHRLLTVSRARRWAEELPDWVQRPARDLARWLMDRNLEREPYPAPPDDVLVEVRARLAADRERLRELLATHWPERPELLAEVDRWPTA